MDEGRPVSDFSIEFRWQTTEWLALFDEQVSLIQEDIARARAEGRVIVYLSCPISSRGGGYHGTNVDIARHTQGRLLADWGHRFWILNPAQYQMESKEGTGLIRRHARTLGISESTLHGLPRPTGGDYMRMWTRVLVEDHRGNFGMDFDAFYFLGPSDVRDFFTRGGAVTVTAGVEEYFARKYSMDPDFRDYYSRPGIAWDPGWEQTAKKRGEQQKLREEWEEARKRFFRFYAVRGSIAFSLGSHDEWNILRLLNEKRLQASESKTRPSGDVGELIAGFFDGRQVAPAAVAAAISGGYAFKE